MANRFDTHEVGNQPPPFEDVNLFTSDVALQEAVQREGAGAAHKRLLGFGLVAGSADMLEHGRLANEHPPRLITHDRNGRRVDRVEHHPSYHACLEMSFAEGLNASPWQGGDQTPQSAPRPGAHVERAAGLFMAAEVDAGHCAVLATTNASIPLLTQAEASLGPWLKRATSRTYDPRPGPIEEKSSAAVGWGMTEKQVGSEEGALTTRAEPVSGASGETRFALTGHKWFLTAPASDAFIMLAQTEKGVGAFLVPRMLADGSLNALRLMRLKSKVGTRSVATAEVELAAAEGWLIGEEGHGLATTQELQTSIRLDCSIVSAGLMRYALASAIHHAEHRTSRGRPLIGESLMELVLADLALDVEAATALAFRLARAFDRRADARAAAWRRLMTPVTKYWVTKIAPHIISEALECHGGNGYVEEWPVARLYRDAPAGILNDGPGNVMAREVMHILQREPEVAEIVMEELGQAAGDDQHLKAAHRRLETVLQEPRYLDQRARLLVEGLAVLAAGTILRAHVAPSLADAFIATRMGATPRQTFGQGLEWTDTRSIVSRASPNRS